MKKFILTSSVIFTFLLYAALKRFDLSNTSNNSTNFNSPNISSFQPPLNSNGNNSKSVSANYSDGVYTGSSADAFYGNVQVQATIKGGKITDVQFLDYPSDRGHSIVVNQYAMPQLKSEALQVQSSNVDIVSGATATSLAFIQSLSSALSQAQK